LWVPKLALRRFGTPQVVRLDAGDRTEWRIDETLRKFYVTF
jgi:uncharacterized cupin superfamily protein